MNPVSFDSRLGLGTDQDRRAPVGSPYVETSSCVPESVGWTTIRVVLGHLGDAYRFSAASVDIIAEGTTIGQAWDQFLARVRARDDAAWLTFDVGPTRPHEVSAGLDAPEDEDWAEPADASGGD